MLQFIPAALGTAAKLASVGGGIYGINEIVNLPKNRRKEILKGDYNPDTREYELEGFDKLLANTGFIQESSLRSEKDKQLMNKLKRDPYVKRIQSKDGSTVLTEGMDLADFKIAYEDQISSINQAQDLKEAVAKAEVLRKINKPETDKEQSRYEDRLRREDQLLLSQERARLDNLEYQRSRDRREDMRYNESLERLDRKDRRTAISSATAGLAALAAAFAI